MKALSPEVARQVRAATGWLELGNHFEANEELEEIEARLRAHPDVLAVRWRIYAKGEKWETALELARAEMKMRPRNKPETLYALAVVACRLRRDDEARTLLAEAFEAGGNAIKLRALEDANLERVWKGP